MVTTVTRTPLRRRGRCSILILAGLLSAACSESSSVSKAVSDASKSVADTASAAAEQLGLVNAPAKGVPVKPFESPTPAEPKKTASNRTATASSDKDASAAGGQKTEPVVEAAAVEPPAPAPAAVPKAETAVAGGEPDSTPAPAPHGTPIYSEDDPDVTPAELLTNQESNPVFRGIQPDMNTMELVISELGRVEQVRLLTPARRMTDMLLLSGAKTWKFSPAMRNGQPVRYRTAFSWPSLP